MPARHKVSRQIVAFPTPDLRDLLFYENRDSDQGQNKDFVYKEPHPDPVKYPNYKLTHVAPAPTEAAPGNQRWYYAADRQEQENHNWRISYPYAGLTNCPRFSCSFVLPIAEYLPVDKGTAHPLDLGDDTLSTNLRFKGAKLMFEREIEVPEELRSVYRAFERIYDRVPTVVEQLSHGVETTYPYAGLDFCPRRTRTLVIARGTYEAEEPGTADPIFENALLIGQEQVEPDDEIIKNLYVIVRKVYDEIPTIEEQEAHNFERTHPYQSDERFPRTERKYVVLREDLDDAVIPSETLNTVHAAEGSSLSFRRTDRFPGMEDSLYVLVTLAHDTVPRLDDEEGGGADFLLGFGYAVSRPYGTAEFPRVTWRIPAIKADYEPSDDYAECPFADYTELVLTDEIQEADPQNASLIGLVRVYDTLPGPELIQEIREKFGDVPEKYINERVVEVFRQPVANDETIDALDGTAPNAVGGAIMRTELGPDGSSKVILTKGRTRVTYTFGSRTDVEYDEETGRTHNVVSSVVAAGTAGSNLDGSGNFSVVDALNRFFSLLTTRKATTLGTVASGNHLTYDTIVNWGWPAVLQGVNFFAVEAKDGHLERYGWDILMKEAYSGPCRATIVESWSPTAQAVPSVVHLMSTAIEFDFPMTRHFSIPRCLHPTVTLTEVVGSDHPDLAPATTTKSFAATNYTDWPTSIIGGATQTPYRGGFRMKVMTVYKPA